MSSNGIYFVIFQTPSATFHPHLLCYLFPPSSRSYIFPTSCCRIKSEACLRCRISVVLHVEMHYSHVYDWINMFYLYIPPSDPSWVLCSHPTAVSLEFVCCLTVNLFIFFCLALSAGGFIITMGECFVFSKFIYFINKIRNIFLIYVYSVLMPSCIVRLCFCICDWF